jgi:hypothetical protein
LLQYNGLIVFDRWLFDPYIPQKALSKKTFPTHDACIYIFHCSCSCSCSVCYHPTTAPLITTTTKRKHTKAIDDKTDIQPSWKSSVTCVTINLIQEIRTTLLLKYNSKKIKSKHLHSYKLDYK